MTERLSDASPPVESRRVLIWREDDDESRVEPTVGDAASFLGVSGEAVIAAIDSGEVLGGWFVDWDASEP